MLRMGIMVMSRIWQLRAMGEGFLSARTWMEAVMWIMVAMAGACFVRPLAQQIKRRRSKANVVDWPLLGMLPSILANMDRYYDWITELLLSNAGSYHFRGPWLTSMNYFFTADPRNIEHALRSNFANYPKGPDFIAVFHDLLGNGIFNADDELWRMQRKASSLQLHAPECRRFTEAFVIESVEKKLLPVLKHLSSSSRRSGPIDLQDLMLRFTFDTMCMVGFGMDTGCLVPDLPSNPFASAFEDALECTVVRFFLPSSWWRVLRLLGLGLERRMPESLSIIDSFIEHVIVARRQELEEADGPNRPTAKSDLLSCFLQAGVDSQNTRFLKDISINFLLAGRDTSALALSWFFWLVATHPHVEAKIVDEVRHVIRGSATTTERSSLTRSELNRLTYLHAALSEALRLYPSVPADFKHVLADDVLPDGNRVKKGQKLIYHIYSMGRMESIWGPDCESFRPERWLSDDDSEASSSLRRVSPFLFPAFNAGPRTCLGKDIAYLLMKAVASAVLYNYRIVLVPGYRAVPKLSITLYMKNGLLVTLEPRRWP